MKGLMFGMIVLLTSCDLASDKDEQKCMNWINSHPKPIVVISQRREGLTLTTDYILKDSNGVLYQTDFVSFNFPDSIK